jgi:hypothetical protein
LRIETRVQYCAGLMSALIVERLGAGWGAASLMELDLSFCSAGPAPPPGAATSNSSAAAAAALAAALGCCRELRRCVP